MMCYDCIFCYHPDDDCKNKNSKNFGIWVQDVESCNDYEYNRGTLIELKVLKNYIEKLKNKYVKDEELQATIILVEKAVNDDIVLIESGKCTPKQENDMKRYIDDINSGFIKYEIIQLNKQ